MQNIITLAAVPFYRSVIGLTSSLNCTTLNMLHICAVFLAVDKSWTWVYDPEWKWQTDMWCQPGCPPGTKRSWSDWFLLLILMVSLLVKGCATAHGFKVDVSKTVSVPPFYCVKVGWDRTWCSFLHLDDMLYNLTKTEIIGHRQEVRHSVTLHFQQWLYELKLLIQDDGLYLHNYLQ